MDRTAPHTPAPPRRLRMVDLMVLVAIAALAALVLRRCHRVLLLSESHRMRAAAVNRPLAWLNRWFDPGLYYVGWLLLFAALAVVALALLPPSAPLGVLRRRPGFVLSAVAVAVVSVWGATLLATSLFLPPSMDDPFWGHFVAGSLMMAGWSAAGATLALVAMGLLRRSRSPLDRLGVTTGFGWLTLKACEIAWMAAVYLELA